jgi:hypothetical protein
MMHQQKSPDRRAPVQGFKSNYLRTDHNEPAPKMAVAFTHMLQGQARVIAFVGSNACWNQARLNNLAGRDAVSLSPGETLDSRSWRCVRGRSVVVVELKDTGAVNRAELVRHLATWGAREVALIPHDRDPKKAVFWGLS